MKKNNKNKEENIKKVNTQDKNIEELFTDLDFSCDCSTCSKNCK
jgi:queuine/archaeosine tRNA-ribosyltransferase